MVSADTKLNVILACTVFLVATVLAIAGAGVYGYYQQKKTIDDILHIISLAKQFFKDAGKLRKDVEDVKEKVGDAKEQASDLLEDAKTFGKQARKAVGNIL